MILRSDEQTRQFGRDFAKKIKNGGIICLYGNLGAGKTTFTQGLAEGLGIHHRIISPTFVIVRTYEIGIKHYESSIMNKRDSSLKALNDENNNFYHIDLYRTSSVQGLKDLGLSEIFANPENIVVVEWAEKLGSLLPVKRFDINFNVLSENEREVSVRVS